MSTDGGPTVIAVVGPTATGKSDLGFAVGAGAGRRDRRCRREPALPGHGHRHRQGAPGRASRHPSPPARRPRRDAGGERRRLPAARASRRERHPVAGSAPGRRRRLGPVRASRCSTARHPTDRPGRAAPDRGAADEVVAGLYADLVARDPLAADADRTEQPPAHRAGPRGHRAHRAPVLRDDAAPGVRPPDDRPRPPAATGGARPAHRRTASQRMWAGGLVDEMRGLVGHGMRSGRTASRRSATPRRSPTSTALARRRRRRRTPSRPPDGWPAARSRGSGPTRESPGSTRRRIRGPRRSEPGRWPPWPPRWVDGRHG